MDLFGIISLDLLDRFSQYLHHMTYERALRADDGSVAFFSNLSRDVAMATNNVTKMYQRRLISPAFGALELENKLQYHGLAMRVSSAYDAFIWCENFVKFDPVTPELTWLICERQV